MKLMVIGGGGREHAIIKKLKENKSITALYALPGNGGMAADAELVDVWVEDCASAITQMHLMADALHVGSCWLQVRLRKAPDGVTDTQDVVRDLLGIPEKYGVMAILTLGMPASHPGPKAVDDLLLEKIHHEHF